MRVLDIHQREFGAPADRVGALLEQLATRQDPIWPQDRWPPMRFDRPISPGAAGGHGPIRYVVDAHEPGLSVRFRFTAPAGFDGGHRFEIEPLGEERTLLRHVIEMKARGWSCLAWLLAIHPLHNALIEDAFDRTAANLDGTAVTPRQWSAWVKLLRFMMRRRGRSRA